jgi:hypothetical protein
MRSAFPPLLCALVAGDNIVKAKPVQGPHYQHVLEMGLPGTGFWKGIAEPSPSCETLEGGGVKFDVGIEFSGTYAYVPLVWLSWKE